MERLSDEQYDNYPINTVIARINTLMLDAKDRLKFGESIIEVFGMVREQAFDLSDGVHVTTKLESCRSKRNSLV